MSTFIELGPCTPERQFTPRNSQTIDQLKIDLSTNTVHRLNTEITPAVSQVVARLLERQQKIIDGRVGYVNKGNLIGVNVRAMSDTVETVPYLTHLDFASCVRELTEFADFTVLNLAEQIETSGILQYYKKGTSLDKLLKNAHKARVNELGKVAAHQFEDYLEKN